MLEFVEQHVTGGVAYVKITEDQAIDYMKQQRSYSSNQEALLDFVSIHWAYEVGPRAQEEEP